MDGCESEELVNQLQYNMRILQDKYSHIEFSEMKLWSSNRGKNYCALKIHSKHKHHHIDDDHIERIS